MGRFEIIKRSGDRIPLNTAEPFCALKSAVHNSTLMGDDNVQLSIISTEIMSFDTGDKILINGQEYTIRTKVSREKLAEDHFVYDVTFYGVMYELMKSLYRNTDADGKSTSHTFDLTYSIRDFVKVLIYNVNRDYPGLWQFDEESCPDTEPRTLSFSKNNCLQVLQKLCSESEFKLEFLITQAEGVRTIHIGKFGSKVVPPAGNEFFEWGKGLGLYKLKEQKVDDKAIITRLWVEGGTTNIRSDYRNYSERLQLPYPKRLNKKEHTLSDGTIVAAGSEMIGISDDNNRYLEDADLRDMIGSNEDAKSYDNIFPKRTGEVTELVDGDINSFIDSTMDFDLAEADKKGTKYLINGVSAKITFVSGKLAGQQFELKGKGGYEHANKKFALIPFTDKRGLTIPTVDSEAYRIQVGDKYKITEINLPKSYEDDAEEELWYTSVEDFKPMTQARAQYQLTLDRSYFLDAMPTDSETCVFNVGDYVPVKDTRLGIEKNIRIQKVSRNLLLEHDYTLTLSDITAISIQSQTVLDVKDHEMIIESNRLRDFANARRGWRTTEELRNMVYDTDGYFDPENIRPNSIDTNMLTVGSKSQQFVLTDVILEPNVSGLGNRLNASAGVLAHLSVDEDGVRKWNMGASEFTMVNSGGYYLFAKCSKTGDSGVWYLTQKQLKFEPTDDPNNYYFLVGILSSCYQDGFRDFVATHGFTRINGRVVTTGRIASVDGATYFDLDKSEICGKILFKRADGSNKTIDELGFDNTQTAIDGGIVTSGTIQVSGNKTDVLAGMTGEGVNANSVRFWAGVPFKYRENAPFRVLQSGDIILTKLHAIGAEIYNEKDDRMSRMSIIGNHIVGKTNDETNLIISNEYNPGMVTLDSGIVSIPTNIDLKTGFSPPITDDFVTQDSIDEVILEYHNCVLVNYPIGYVPPNAKLRLSADPEVSWDYPFWYPIEDGLSEYNPDMLYSANYMLESLELRMYVDGIKHIKLAQLSTIMRGTSHLQNKGGESRTLQKEVTDIIFKEGGVVSIQLVCPRMTVSVDGDAYSRSEQFSNTFVNAVSYPVEAGDYVRYPYFVAIVSQLNLEYTPPQGYKGLMGFISFQNGFMHKHKNGVIKFNEDVFSIRINDIILELSKDGIRKSLNGGSSWIQI